VHEAKLLYVIGKLMGLLSLTLNLSWRVILASNRQERIKGLRRLVYDPSLSVGSKPHRAD
jgi:hypothetical protein